MEKNRTLNHSLTHSVTQLIWCSGNRSLHFGKARSCDKQVSELINKNVNQVDRYTHCWELTFNDLKIDVADKEPIPLASITGRLVHPAVHIELHQSTWQIQQWNRYQIRLPLDTQRCTQAVHTTLRFLYILIHANKKANITLLQCPQMSAGLTQSAALTDTITASEWNNGQSR